MEDIPEVNPSNKEEDEENEISNEESDNIDDENDDQLFVKVRILYDRLMSGRTITSFDEDLLNSLLLFFSFSFSLISFSFLSGLFINGYDESINLIFALGILFFVFVEFFLIFFFT